MLYKNLYKNKRLGLKDKETDFYNAKYENENKRKFYVNIRERSRQYFLKRFLKKKSGKALKVIELGCGNGNNLILVKKLYPSYEIDGCDLSEKGISIGKLRNKDINFFVGDITNLNINKEYDIVLSIGTFEHLNDFQQKEHFKIIKNLLKDNGYLIFIAPNLPVYKNYELKYDFHPFENAKDITYIKDLIEKEFVIKEIRTSHFFEPLPRNNSNDFLLKKIYIIFYIIFGNIINNIFSKSYKGQEIAILAKKNDKMKILFITEVSSGETLGIMSIISLLNKRHTCKVIIEKNYGKKIFLEIKRFSPEIVCYSVTTGFHKHFIELNKKIKKIQNVFSVFGGPHPTFFPEMINEEGVDAICIGEGEYAMLELVDKLEKKKDIRFVKNFWIKKNGKIYKNEVRPLIENLDELPFMDRSFYNDYKHLRNSKTHFFLATRGCPYNCSYCFNHIYQSLYKGKGRIVRRRSVNNLIKEIKEVRKRFPLSYIRFVDDLFFSDKKWIDEFSKKYKEEINLPFNINVRVNLVNDDIIKKLKEAGLDWVTMGIESGNSYLRNNILNRNMSEEQIINACRIIKKNKIRLMTQNMICLPNETLDMAFETLNLNIKCKPDFAWISIFQPYPKTEIEKYIKEDYNLNDIDESYYNDSILNLNNKKELVNLHKLFSICVRFPFLIYFMKHLIKMPKNNILYSSIFHLYRIYIFKYKSKRK